jgi:hypothetical protein
MLTISAFTAWVGFLSEVCVPTVKVFMFSGVSQEHEMNTEFTSLVLHWFLSNH